MNEDEEIEEVVDEGSSSQGGGSGKFRNLLKSLNNKRKAAKAAKAAGATKAASGTAIFASPVGWIILIVIIIIIVLGGIIGFYTIMPGLYKDKVTKFLATVIDNWSGGKTKQAELLLNPTKKYISDLGYDLVGFGFVQNPENAEPIKENDDGTVEYAEDPYDDYLEAYLRAELETYSFESVGWGWGADIPRGMIRLLGNTHLATPWWGQKKIYGSFSGGTTNYSTNEITGFINRLFNDKPCFTLEIANKTDENGKEVEGEKVLRVSVSEHIYSKKRTTTEYPLADWLEQYGLPSYFTIALHVGTMAPEFSKAVVDFIHPKVTLDLKEEDVMINVEFTETYESCGLGKHSFSPGNLSIMDVNSNAEMSDSIKKSPYYSHLSKIAYIKCDNCSSILIIPTYDYEGWCNDYSYDIQTVIDKAEKNEFAIVDKASKTIECPQIFHRGVPYITEIDTWYKHMEFSYSKETKTKDYSEESPYEDNGTLTSLVEQATDFADGTITSIEEDYHVVTDTKVKDNTAVIRILLSPESYSSLEQIRGALGIDENKKVATETYDSCGFGNHHFLPGSATKIPIDDNDGLDYDMEESIKSNVYYNKKYKDGAEIAYVECDKCDSILIIDKGEYENWVNRRSCGYG